MRNGDLNDHLLEHAVHAVDEIVRLSLIQARLIDIKTSLYIVISQSPESCPTRTAAHRACDEVVKALARVETEHDKAKRICGLICHNEQQ